MSTPRRVARNAGALILSQGATLTLNFVAWAHLAATLGPSQFGIIGFGTALVAYFGVGVQLGFDAVVVREGARDPARVPELADRLMALRLTLCALALVGYAGVVMALQRPPAFTAALLVLGVQLLVMATRLNWAFQAVEEMRTVAVRDTIAAVLNAATVLAFVRSPEQVVLAAALTASVPLVGNAWLWGAYRRRFGRLRPVVDRDGWVRLLRPAIPLAASALLIEVYGRTGLVLLEAFRSTAEVGLYASAHRFVSLTQLPANIAFAVFLPVLAGVLGQPTKMQASGRTLAQVLLPIGLVVAAVGPWLARDVLVLAYGEAYAPAGTAFALMLIGAGVVHVNMTAGIPLMAWDLQKPYMWAILGGAGVNVALSLALVPAYGMVGAAASTLIAEGVVCVRLLVLYRRTTGDLPLAPAVRAVPTAAAAGVVAALGAGAGWPVLLVAPLAATVAAVAALATGLADRAQLASLFARSSPDP